MFWGAEDRRQFLVETKRCLAKHLKQDGLVNKQTKKILDFRTVVEIITK